MRIAVCDDEPEALERITELLCEYDGSIVPDRFISASELLSCAERTSYDAVFLDIEMSSPNGYEAAMELIKSANHPLIVFVTHTSAYAVRGYGVAFRYLLKPVTETELARVMHEIEAELSSKRVILNIDGSPTVLSVDEILYAEVFGHTTVLYTGSGSFKFRSTLKDLLAQLPAGLFCSPHQSYLINLMHVRSAGRDTVAMSNGDIVPISRRKRAEFMHGFHMYLGGARC